MSGTVTQEPRVLHAIPGRMRVHLPDWPGRGQLRLEQRLRQAAGVARVEANPLTGNVLIAFNPRATDPQALLKVLTAAEQDTAHAPPEEPELPPALVEKEHGSRRRARIAVRGLDRDPDLSRRVVERLQRHRGVRARANPLTGRVLVEFDAHHVDLHDLLADVLDVELPDLPGEDRPAHPLDPAPLIQSATRTVGAALGLGLLAVRRLFGLQTLPGARAAATTSGGIGLLRSFPVVRNGLRELLGQDAADLFFGLTQMLTLTLSSNPLGLAVTGSEALILLREVVARRAAWRRYEERLGGTADAEPGAQIRLESGERTPRAARVIEGTGTAIGRDGLPRPLAPGAAVSAGARLLGGPFVLDLQSGRSFTPGRRPAPPAPSLYQRYIQGSSPASLAYAVLTAVLTRSFARTFEALLLVNPRTAVIGMEAANLEAASRVLRAGVTIIGTRRRHRAVRLPDVLLLDGPRVLTNGVEITSALPLTGVMDAAEILALAAGVAVAAGSPWGRAFPPAGHAAANDGSFDGRKATALVDGVRYTLGPAAEGEALPEEADRLRQRGDYLLLLRGERDSRPLGAFALRPRLAQGAADLVEECRQRGVSLRMLPGGELAAAQAVARRAEVPLEAEADAVAAVRDHQRRGALVALVSDSAHAAEAFAASDLAIGLSSGRSSQFAARVDLLAPDLAAIAAIVEAAARREAAVRDAVGFSVVNNLAGAVWGFQGRPGVQRVSLVTHITALGSLADGWFRLRGGDRPGASLAYLTDPRPERWGRQSVAGVLRAFQTTEAGLTSAQAEQRRRAAPQTAYRQDLLSAVFNQLRSPITGILGTAAGLAILAGEVLDAAIIGATVAVNMAIGTWQERQADQAAEALKRLGTATARLLRDGAVVTVPAGAVVPGDILLLASGDRVAADGRLLRAQGLEVDEASLTGESLPVAKQVEGSTPESHTVLEGSDVVVGTGRAVVVAVGRHTRMGAMASALTLEETQQSPLGTRLAQTLHVALPVSVVGGAAVALPGLLAGNGWMSQLKAGISIAVAVVPESLPLLAGTGQVGVARRLAGHHALLRRLSAVEALGRVDVACTDKTGTLTEGRLALRLVADAEHEARLPDALGADLRQVLLTAALASPHPEAPGRAAHPTDVAVVRAAQAAGLGDELRREREREAPFDPTRSFYAAVVPGRLCVKGAPEALVPRCVRVRRGGEDRPLDETGRQALLARARHLAGQGLRVLMVAEGAAGEQPEDPQRLAALGFVGIHDPLRPTVQGAVRRCRDAGVRVLMITGDHPATARAIAREAGLLDHDQEILTGPELTELQNGELDRRLERATVVARATPLDKLRIIESLQRLGHTVAMTGDGVNDAPALRLADVGVAMGRGGTEVARQAADVVLTDDDFATLVEALVEGRGFWQNMRRGLGLLLGGNLGELGLMVGASLAGLAPPLNTRQILVVNLITDALPALSVVLQQPEHRNLAELAREGTSALDVSLRWDVLRRGASTATPSLAAYLVGRGTGSMAQASSVAFGSIVATQLAQTLNAGWVEGSLSRSVQGAVAASAGLLVTALAVPPVRGLLGLALPTPLGWGLIGTSALSAVVLNRFLSAASPSRLVPVPAGPAGNGAPPRPRLTRRPSLLLPRPGTGTLNP